MRGEVSVFVPRPCNPLFVFLFYVYVPDALCDFLDVQFAVIKSSTGHITSMLKICFILMVPCVQFIRPKYVGQASSLREAYYPYIDGSIESVK